MGGGMDGKAYISDGNSNILELDRNDDGRQVNAYYDNPDNNWNDNGAFAVPVSQLSSFLLLFLRGVLFCELSVPATEHSANFVDFYGESEIFLVF